MPNLLAALNLFAFTLHEVLDCGADLWRRCRAKAGTRRRFFDKLRVPSEMFWFPDCNALLMTILSPPRRPAMLPAHPPAPSRPLPAFRPLPGSCASPRQTRASIGPPSDSSPSQTALQSLLAIPTGLARFAQAVHAEWDRSQ